MQKELYQKHFAGATLIKERHLYSCECSYCMPNYRQVHRNKFGSIGLMLPENKERNSWRILWWRTGKGAAETKCITYLRWTLPKFV